MHKIGFTNASRLDKVSGSQTFRLRGEGSSILMHLVGGLNDLSDIATRTLCHDNMSKWIDPNSNREEWYDNH